MSTSPGTEIVLPATGEMVSLDSPPDIAQALEYLRDLEQQIRMAKAELVHAMVEHSKVIGSKTIKLSETKTATIKGGSETIYDPEAIIEGLREAGMSESRILEIVRETVSYKVNAVEAKRAAAANTVYAEVITTHSHVEERRPSVEIKG